MKAIIWTKYGSPDVLQLKEVEKPTPTDKQVLIRIHATTATSGDCEMRGLRGSFWYRWLIRAYVGLRTPQRITILGMELAGEIEAIGKDVTRFKTGDQVFAATGFVEMGSYVDYKCLLEDPKQDGLLTLKPTNMTYEEAAAVPVGGIEALNFLRQGQIQRGQKILINGAGGTIGVFAVQLAKYFEAEVTAVDSADKLDMLRAIGADHVIDYAQQDFTQNGERYDFILDIAGKSPFSNSLTSLKQHGCYVIANVSLVRALRGWWTSMTSSKKVLLAVAKPKLEDLVFLRGLIEAGKLKAFIDKRYPLEQIADAHRYVETGRKKGNVIITVR